MPRKKAAAIPEEPAAEPAAPAPAKGRGKKRGAAEAEAEAPAAPAPAPVEEEGGSAPRAEPRLPP